MKTRLTRPYGELIETAAMFAREHRDRHEAPARRAFNREFSDLIERIGADQGQYPSMTDQRVMFDHAKALLNYDGRAPQPGSMWETPPWVGRLRRQDAALVEAAFVPVASSDSAEAADEPAA